MFQWLEFFGALVDDHYFGFTETKECLVSTDGFPCNWGSRAVDEKFRERAQFEQFKRSALFDCTTELITLAGILEGCEFVAFLWGRSCRFFVCLLIVMMWEMVEGLYCWGLIWVERYFICICTCKIFESMNCGLVMLRMWSIAVWGKKFYCGWNSRVGAGCNPIDAANDTLIDLSLKWKISIYCVNGSSWVNWEARTISSRSLCSFCSNYK